MNRLKKPKLNELLSQWPTGIILTSTWLKEHGYYKQLVKLYCDKGWLKSIGRGAYVRLNDQVTWQGAVKALQEQLNLSVHVGGLTALQLYGISQYQMLNKQQPTFYLFNTTNEKIQILLNACLSIKVKCLFLYLAEKCNLSFLNDLDLSTINLGSGKRVIGEGGTYNAKWLLSLPRLNDMNESLEDEYEQK